MHDLIIFIIAIVFISVVLPFLNSISELIFALTELIKSRISVGISKNNKEIIKLSGNEQTTVMGFSTNEDAEEFYDDEEEMNGLIYNKKVIGFTGGTDVKNKK